jgi:predicted TIM-barrel fold metal-dependent hydrolase
MTTALDDVAVFDADNHLYETKEALTKYLPDRYKSAIEYIEVGGRTKIMVKGQVSEYIPNPTFDVVARPGIQEDFYRNGNPEGKTRREIFGKPVPCIPAWREPKPRLEMMDSQGIDRTLLFPTLASLVEERMRDDPRLMHATIHALNQWMLETWTFNYEDRIFPTPVITLPIVEKAIEELDWVVANGAKAVLIRPAAVPGFEGSRSFGLPEFDPFWAKVVEHDILVGMHASDSGYARYANDWEGNSSEYLPFQPTAFRYMASYRPIEDAMSALICHGALSRFPQLKIAVIENGSGWVGPLLKHLALVYKLMPQFFTEDPADVFRRNIFISPFWEEDLLGLAELIGEDNLLFGSDYPHPEGLAHPPSYIKELDGFSEQAIRKVMGGNMARLMKTPSTLVATR